MTLDQLVTLTQTHIAQRDHAKHILDTHYYQLEESDEAKRWTAIYLKHKKIVEALNRKLPDDI